MNNKKIIEYRNNKMPKYIHYCWYGKGEKPAVFEKCLKSWKQYMPECKIIEWNESNTDLEYCSFLSNAYKEKKYAFVSDVVRLMAVYSYGGMYLDTDVELFESFEPYFKYDAFFFFQNHTQINTGMGFGAKKNHPLVKSMLDEYCNLDFSINKMNQLACPLINTRIIKENIDLFKEVDYEQIIDNVIFVPCLEYYKKAKHYGEFSWKDKEQEEIYKLAKKEHGFWRIKGIIRHQAIFAFFDKYNLRKVSKVYAFITHDLIDYGLFYWIVKVWKKVIGK